MQAQHLDTVLAKIVETQPNTEFLDLQNQGITSVTQISKYIEQLKDLKDLNLEDNRIETFSDEPELSKCFAQI
jgi:TRAP-type C4-dicarboxylate transport system substrate-binding protein